MADTLVNRVKLAWNAFRNGNQADDYSYQLGPGNSTRPDRSRFNLGNEKSLVASVYTRIGIDVSAVNMQHVRLDQNGRYIETIDSGLNNCLTMAANVDQTGRAFIQDVAVSLCDEGSIAIVPVDTTVNPMVSGSYDVITMRTGKIVDWYPRHVRVNVYNERSGQRENIILAKEEVVIIENPLYAVMNEPNSTLKRLINKLNLLDAIDTQSGSGKLDLIFQLPYVIKTEARREQAEKRRNDIETQLKDSKYGIVYTDGSEKVTQLNRPAENNLMVQIQYLTSTLYSQLGLTEAIFTGTADEKEMLNYYNRTVEPFLSAITDGMIRTFLTKTGRAQGQSIKYFKNPFGLLPASELGPLADTLTRNAILSTNEIRDVMGYKPSNDEGADKLQNKNLNPPTGEAVPPKPQAVKKATKGASINEK